MAVEKDSGGSEGNRELTSGNRCRANSNTGRNITAQPSWRTWQFKDSNLSRVGGTWKRACVPWSGWPNAVISLHLLCAIFYFFFLTAKIILTRCMTWAEKFWVSKQWRAEKSAKEKRRVNLRGHIMVLSEKEGSHCRQPIRWAFLILPLPFLRIQAHRFKIIK